MWVYWHYVYISVRGTDGPFRTRSLISARNHLNWARARGIACQHVVRRVWDGNMIGASRVCYAQQRISYTTLTARYEGRTVGPVEALTIPANRRNLRPAP